MKFIEEIVVEEFLPTFRSMLARALHERGHTQLEIAEMLGVSQSAVSKYIHGEVTPDSTIAEQQRVERLVERLADGLANGDLRPAEALLEAEACIATLGRGGVLARLHAEQVPGLTPEEAAEIHTADGTVQEHARVRASVRRGLRVLENTDGFAGLIPAVGSNLAECPEGAETIEEVAAVPGRIIDVHDRVTVPGEPEFGVSQHVAGLLLAARRAGSDARAVLDVAYEPSLREALERAGHASVAFDAEADLETAVPEALTDRPDATVLYQTGGFGVEPVLYVLGPDAPTVARRVRHVLESATHR